MTHSISLKKALVGVVLAMFVLTATAPFARAESYYRYSYSDDREESLLIAQLNALLARLEAMQGRTTGNANSWYHQNYNVHGPKKKTYQYTSYDNYYRYDDLEVQTDDADVDEDEATLMGEVELHGASYALVWFEYGKNGRITQKTSERRVTDDTRFEATIDGLDEDENYYFRAVAEDPQGYKTYGSIMSFDSEGSSNGHHNSNDDEPEAETDSASNIESNRATLRGSIDMNDFEDGIPFFVYGEDEDQVDDVDDEDTYGDIDTDGDDLQKFQTGGRIDDFRTFWQTVYGLNDDTDYFFRMCVQYEDDDGDDQVTCGDTEDFQTDN